MLFGIFGLAPIISRTSEILPLFKNGLAFAAAAISGEIDQVDLDSHYNLAPDPAKGTQLCNGVTLADFVPGHGGTLKPEYHA